MTIELKFKYFIDIILVLYFVACYFQSGRDVVTLGSMYQDKWIMGVQLLAMFLF